MDVITFSIQILLNLSKVLQTQKSTLYLMLPHEVIRYSQVINIKGKPVNLFSVTLKLKIDSCLFFVFVFVFLQAQH